MPWGKKVKKLSVDELRKQLAEAEAQEKAKDLTPPELPELDGGRETVMIEKKIPEKEPQTISIIDMPDIQYRILVLNMLQTIIDKLK